ncbi:MAG: hypothetical protein HY044_03205 [Candidatus Woesebacteria bacterium]|nr:MAG: hypothetical protein HY044_03205 [Candidatus Woesebacteria bacterium]
MFKDRRPGIGEGEANQYIYAYVDQKKAGFDTAAVLKELQTFYPSDLNINNSQRFPTIILGIGCVYHLRLQCVLT